MTLKRTSELGVHVLAPQRAHIPQVRPNIIINMFSVMPFWKRGRRRPFFSSKWPPDPFSKMADAGYFWRWLPLGLRRKYSKLTDHCKMKVNLHTGYIVLKWIDSVTDAWINGVKLGLLSTHAISRHVDLKNTQIKINLKKIIQVF